MVQVTKIKRYRSKPRRGRQVSREYLDFIHAHRCLLAGRLDTTCSGNLNAHHVKTGPGHLKQDFRAVPLCEAHHLHGFGPDSIERGRKRWETKFGIDLERVIETLNREFREAA